MVLVFTPFLKERFVSYEAPLIRYYVPNSTVVQVGVPQCHLECYSGPRGLKRERGSSFPLECFCGCRT